MPSNTTIARSDVTALILAAGEGRRLGGIAKVFLEFSGHTLMQHAALLVAPFVGRIVIGVRSCDLALAQAQAAQLGVGIPVDCVVGGATRQESLGHLIDAATTPYLLIHEVARPWVEPAEFQQVLADLRDHEAVVTCTPMPVRDSIALREGGFLGRALPRSEVVSLQTPHGYRRELLCRAYALARTRGWNEDSTAALVMRTEARVHLVEGSPRNVKITYPEDLVLLNDSSSSHAPTPTPEAPGVVGRRHLLTPAAPEAAPTTIAAG
jgi:2-C-methyl-D-erythritol 4-phosphate cytidylyltransferase